jgi:hypothetical protein
VLDTTYFLAASIARAIGLFEVLGRVTVQFFVRDA